MTEEEFKKQMMTKAEEKFATVMSKIPTFSLQEVEYAPVKYVADLIQRNVNLQILIQVVLRSCDGGMVNADTLIRFLHIALEELRGDALEDINDISEEVRA